MKIVLYQLSCHKDYDINEKSYISDILINNYNQIYKTCYLPKKGQKKEIIHFISVINDTELDKKQLNTAIDNFIKLGRRDIGSHLPSWIDIIRKSKEIISKKVINVA